MHNALRAPRAIRTVLQTLDTILSNGKLSNRAAEAESKVLLFLDNYPLLAFIVNQLNSMGTAITGRIPPPPPSQCKERPFLLLLYITLRCLTLTLALYLCQLPLPLPSPLLLLLTLPYLYPTIPYICLTFT